MASKKIEIIAIFCILIFYTKASFGADFSNWSFRCPVNLSETIVHFVLPTPNNEIINKNYTFINVTLNKEGSSATLQWNGTNESMSGSGINWFRSKTSLADGNYTFKVYANDTFGRTGLSHERYVVIDAPPAPITNLNETMTTGSKINWTWTNPINSDYNHAEVYLDNVFKENVSAPVNWYQATRLTKNTTYELEVRPVDNAGNTGEWTNDTAKTKGGRPA
ncbi:TPA: fibronectin type III domain-containing protein [archaeon]|uniref:Fibronectin type III domain-containing protein n=1 Tax=Candidatus Naiadarchaeum limnaeum TaxID=2756139 RepID=A0A832XMB8_9ARCH|nr:fibronectin type III domain-containing protein [Candidatus Naiadarchaeum limnaeum]